jgi:hypothetical protein
MYHQQRAITPFGPNATMGATAASKSNCVSTALQGYAPRGWNAQGSENPPLYSLSNWRMTCIEAA